VSSQSGEYLAALTGDAIAIYTWSLYPGSSFTGWRKFDIFLGGRPTPSMLFLTNVLLRWPYVAWTNGRRATEVGVCLGLEVFTVGLRAYQICCTCFS